MKEATGRDYKYPEVCVNMEYKYSAAYEWLMVECGKCSCEYMMKTKPTLEEFVGKEIPPAPIPSDGEPVRKS